MGEMWENEQRVQSIIERSRVKNIEMCQRVSARLT